MRQFGKHLVKVGGKNKQGGEQSQSLKETIPKQDTIKRGLGHFLVPKKKEVLKSLKGPKLKWTPTF